MKRVRGLMEVRAALTSRHAARGRGKPKGNVDAAVGLYTSSWRVLEREEEKTTRLDSREDSLAKARFEGQSRGV